MYKSVVTSLVLFGVLPVAVSAAYLSRYRDFEFGAALPAVAKQAGMPPSQAKAVHRRPVLIQTLEWRPQPLGRSTKAEAVEEVLFSFYDGELYRIAVEYDPYQTKGLTTDDIVEAISVNYGKAERSPDMNKTLQGPYGEKEDVVARWQDSQYRYDLVHIPYGPTFKLIGVSKKMEAAAETALLESKRLDDEDAPRREAARVASEEDAAKAILDKARLANKPNFRP